MDPIVIIMDALRDVDDDLEALEVEKRRLQDRQELLRIRQTSLQANIERLSPSNPSMNLMLQRSATTDSRAPEKRDNGFVHPNRR